MARQQGRHRFLCMMSVLIFLLLLADFSLPLLPAQWRAVLVPQDRSGDLAPSRAPEPRPLSHEWQQADSGSVESGVPQNASTRSSALGPPGKEAQGVTTEDLQLLEQRLSDRFVTVDRLEEELYRDALARSASRKERGGQSTQVTVVVPVPPSRPLPHPLPGRQF